MYAGGQSTVPVAARSFDPDLSLAFVQPAQTDHGPETGAYELQIWSATGDGIRIATSNPNGCFANIGLRLGYVLSGEHGPGPLRGRFEYVTDVVPWIGFRLPNQTVWGGGVAPVGAKWDFAARHHLAPYFEIDGGALVTNRNVPQGGSSFNFTASTSAGVHVLPGRFNWSIEARFYHISNGGFAENPSFNSVGISVGFGTFSRPRSRER